MDVEGMLLVLRKHTIPFECMADLVGALIDVIIVLSHPVSSYRAKLYAA